jgi:hypothetical protein
MRRTHHGQRPQAARRHVNRRSQVIRPAAAYRQRGSVSQQSSDGFNAPEQWHEPSDADDIHFIVKPPGSRYRHAVTVQEVRDRLSQLPREFVEQIEVIQFSPMSAKRKLFPCYGMQWGENIYLYPIEESLVEIYHRPPKPQQLIEAKMHGGVWTETDGKYHLQWSEEAIKDFYLNNVLIHEIGHVLDQRNTNAEKREQYANWFAIEYGFRASRGRR